MAEVVRSQDGTLATPLPGNEHRISGLLAGEDIPGPGFVYVASNGLVMIADGSAADAEAAVRGYVQMKAKSGQAVTLWLAGRIAYGPTVGGTPVNPGTSLYLSGTVEGGLADAASTGGTTPIAWVVDTDGRIQLRGLS